MATLGRYQIIKNLAIGGMGEVFLAEDPLCERKIAIKRIRPDLIKHASVRKRFLREAKVATQLTHPSIMPIFDIHQDDHSVFYTMPYIEGETLKKLLFKARRAESEGEITPSISSFIPIFLQICQAVSFSHSKKILHRDLKPENIIVGNFGEVLILDWGIACFINEKENSDDKIDLPPLTELTMPGKIVGTISYMAPERALHNVSSIRTDLYSLGVILYKMLALKLPFRRPPIKEFKKIAETEKYIEPQDIAPHREIPKQLSAICKKALSFDPEQRYSSVQEMIQDVENYIQGHPEWILAESLAIENKEDWEFQENVLLTKHTAISQITDETDWVMLMISKESFYDRTRIETRIRFGENGHGIGFLLAVPDESERKGLEEGFCFYIGQKGSTLFRNNVVVMDFPELILNKNEWHTLRIDKIDHHIYFYLDGILKFTYVNYVPLAGTHIGLLYRDTDFELQEFQVFQAGQNVMVNCLSIPDAFLASKNYDKAFLEYKKIARSFEGRTEGREALFRSGIALLEKGKETKRKGKRSTLFNLSLDAFEKLHKTPGAPLEYLGKSLVYQAENDLEEEAKCLEMALRRFPKHPLQSIIREHLLFRLHETSRTDRKGTYLFTLILLRHVPELLHSFEMQHLIQKLIEHLESPFFIPPLESLSNQEDVHLQLAIQLAFWLNRPITLNEIFQSLPEDSPFRERIQLSLLYLGEDLKFSSPEYEKHQKLTLKYAPTLLTTYEETPTYLWALLLTGDVDAAETFIKKLPTNELHSPKSPYYFLYGIYLLKKESEQSAQNFYRENSETYPQTNALFSHYLLGTLDLKNWEKSAFFFEKIQLYRQLALYHAILGDNRKALSFERKAKI